jgi:hypothetical protein
MWQVLFAKCTVYMCNKFFMTSLYLPSAVVYVQQIFYDKFFCGKFYLRSALCMCNKFSMTSFYMASFICQVQLCMCNKFSMTSFWLSDRCNSYYYPLQQYRVSQKCPPFRNHSCVLLLLYLWEFTLIYMNFGSIDAVKLLRQILVAL